MNLQRLRTLAPYLSLVLGLASAWLSAKHPGRAVWICCFAAVAWLAHFAWLLLERRRAAVSAATPAASETSATVATSAAPAPSAPSAPSATFARPAASVAPAASAKPAALEHAARWATQALAQSMAQSLLWFALPWLWRAAAPTVGQLAYLALLAAIAVCSLWDPLWQRMVAVPAIAAFCLAGATFAGLAATLPMIGVPLGHAPWWAAAGAALPALLHVLGDARWRQPATWTWAQLATLPWILLAGPLREAVPAAPLAVERLTLADDVAGREPGAPLTLTRLPSKAWCYSAISAPAGVDAEVRHVWRRDGAGLTRRVLAVHGGRVGGYRTWSRHPAGQLRGAAEVECQVETLAGQPLGSVTVAR